MQSEVGKTLLTTVILLLLLGLLLPGVVAQTPGEVQWESIGPIGVSILALVPHPTESLTLYAIVDAHGVYKSMDGGGTWQAKNRGIEGLTILSLAIADEEARVLYAGAMYGGVFKSTDGGETWEAMGSTTQGWPEGSKEASELLFVYSLATVNDKVVYAGTGGGEGVYKSEDGGESWRPQNEGLPWGVDVLAILLDSWHEGVLYIGTDIGIFKSEDNGASWQQKSSFLTSVLTFSDDGNTIYSGSSEGLLRSEDAGEHWEVVRQARPDGLLEVRTLLVDNTSLYLGGSGGIYEVLDGRHWESRNGDLPSDGLVVRGIAKRGKWLYVGTGWDIFRSEDNGASWVQLSQGLPERGLIVKEITFGNDKEHSLHIGTWGGGVYKSVDRGATWSGANQGLGAPYIFELTTSNGMLYTATWRALYASDDAGETWDILTAPIYSQRLVMPRPPRNEIYALIQLWEEDSDDGLRRVGRLIKSDDGGSVWQSVESMNVFDVTDVSVNPENGQIVYVAIREGGVYQSVDGGNQWSQFNQGLPLQNVHTLAPGGKAGNILFAGTAIGIYRSDQNGIWERTISGSYDTIVADPSHPNHVYAANSEGALIFSEDYGKTWKSAGSAAVAINDLAVDPQNNDVIYAATEGQSVLRGNFKGLGSPKGLPVSIPYLNYLIGSGVAVSLAVVGAIWRAYRLKRIRDKEGKTAYIEPELKRLDKPSAIYQFATLIRARRQAGDQPYTLLLGSDLSLTPEVRQAVCEAMCVSDDWEAFWTAFRDRSPAERRALLAGPLDDLNLTDGYRCLAELTQAGCFNIILTANIDDALDNALRILPARECQVLCHGQTSAQEIASALSRPAPRVKAVKLRGDINAYKLPLTPEGQFEFPEKLEEAAERLLSQDAILVGDISYDTDIQRCIRQGEGALWVVVPEEPQPGSFLYNAAQSRPGKVISGAEAEFVSFFSALARELGVEI